MMAFFKKGHHLFFKRGDVLKKRGGVFKKRRDICLFLILVDGFLFHYLYH